jgi:hypothetical protein
MIGRKKGSLGLEFVGPDAALDTDSFFSSAAKRSSAGEIHAIPCELQAQTRFNEQWTAQDEEVLQHIPEYAPPCPRVGDNIIMMHMGMWQQ